MTCLHLIISLIIDYQPEFAIPQLEVELMILYPLLALIGNKLNKFNDIIRV